ncbi:hypothetical protein ACGFXC_27350 [Streptomyces sp. NPDC048507]|uniref:PPE family protein, SVP subgroup n=1 Tax=Streptomyces sp. NPDC048507 TaxID=3365560 RepID=UPI00371D6816
MRAPRGPQSWSTTSRTTRPRRGPPRDRPPPCVSPQVTAGPGGAGPGAVAGAGGGSDLRHFASPRYGFRRLTRRRSTPFTTGGTDDRTAP